MWNGEQRENGVYPQKRHRAKIKKYEGRCPLPGYYRYTRHGCVFRREGSKRPIYQNPSNGKRTSVPRRREIDNTARGICQQLGIPPP